MSNFRGSYQNLRAAVGNRGGMNHNAAGGLLPDSAGNFGNKQDVTDLNQNTSFVRGSYLGRTSTTRGGAAMPSAQSGQEFGDGFSNAHLFGNNSRGGAPSMRGGISQSFPDGAQGNGTAGDFNSNANVRGSYSRGGIQLRPSLSIVGTQPILSGTQSNEPASNLGTTNIRGRYTRGGISQLPGSSFGVEAQPEFKTQPESLSLRGAPTRGGYSRGGISQLPGTSFGLEAQPEIKLESPSLRGAPTRGGYSGGGISQLPGTSFGVETQPEIKTQFENLSLRGAPTRGGYSRASNVRGEISQAQVQAQEFDNAMLMKKLSGMPDISKALENVQKISLEEVMKKVASQLRSGTSNDIVLTKDEMNLLVKKLRELSDRISEFGTALQKASL